MPQPIRDGHRLAGALDRPFDLDGEWPEIDFIAQPPGKPIYDPLRVVERWPSLASRPHRHAGGAQEATPENRDRDSRCFGRGERHSPATTDLPITMRLAEPPEPFDWRRSA